MPLHTERTDPSYPLLFMGWVYLSPFLPESAACYTPSPPPMPIPSAASPPSTATTPKTPMPPAHACRSQFLFSSVLCVMRHGNCRARECKGAHDPGNPKHLTGAVESRTFHFEGSAEPVDILVPDARIPEKIIISRMSSYPRHIKRNCDCHCIFKYI